MTWRDLTIFVCVLSGGNVGLLYRWNVAVVAEKCTVFMCPLILALLFVRFFVFFISQHLIYRRCSFNNLWLSELKNKQTVCCFGSMYTTGAQCSGNVESQHECGCFRSKDCNPVTMDGLGEGRTVLLCYRIHWSQKKNKNLLINSCKSPAV